MVLICCVGYWWRVVSRAWSLTGGLFGGAQNPLILFPLAVLPPAVKWYQLGRQASVGAVLGDPIGWGGPALAVILFLVGIFRTAPKIYAEQEHRFAEVEERHHQRVTESRQQIEAIRTKRVSIVFNEWNGLHVSPRLAGP